LVLLKHKCLYTLLSLHDYECLTLLYSHVGMKPLQSEVESSTVKGTFSGFLPQKRAGLGFLVCCDRCFRFATSLILRQRKKQGRHTQGAGSLVRALAPGWARAVPWTDWHQSQMQFPWLVMFAPESRSQHFRLTPENMPLNKNHTLTSHVLLLQPAAEVLSYINPRQARAAILTHLRCSSLLIYFKKF